MSWTFSPHFLLRATGFPVERLLSVAAAASSDEPTDVRLQRERRALFAALGDDRAREALLTSAPLVDTNFDGWRAHAEAGRRNAQDKKRERVLWRFLQRLTTKNDSSSFFGAIALGDFANVSDADLVLPIEARRFAYTTQWVVERMLARAVAELAAAGVHAPVTRRAPGTDAQGRRWQPGKGGFSETPESASVDLDALPSGLVDPIAEARRRLSAEPTSDLRALWLARFDRLEALRDRFAASAGDPGARRAALAALEEEVGAILGAPAQRGEGEFYASRGPVHEQADRTATTIGLPPSWAADLEAAAAPYLELALLAQAPERVTFKRWFERCFDSSRAEPVLWRDVLTAIGEAPMALELAAPASVRAARDAFKRVRQTLRAAIDLALAADPACEEVRLDPASVMPEVETALAALGPFGDAYVNPDFMIALGSDGRPTFILAEAHHLPCLTPCLLPSLAASEAIVLATRRELAALCAPGLPAFPVSYDHSFISVGPDLGAVGLELSGLAKEPPERRATFAELAVHATPDGLRFVVPSHAHTLLDVVPLTRTARLHQAAAAFPLSCPDLGELLAGSDWRSFESLPRLRFGDLIVHRRRFELTPDDLGDVVSNGARKTLAARSGLTSAPRFMFARMESEPKPILIDWGSALATELACWSLRRGETLELSEMAPAPHEAWLRSADGRHTAELRTVLFRRAT